ncbi:hypothetical protein P8452_42608 [Trifolium repens]|nr:hypothetical protein P8452_42608 [Trifolium repens]
MVQPINYFTAPWVKDKDEFEFQIMVLHKCTLLVSYRFNCYFSNTHNGSSLQHRECNQRFCVWRSNECNNYRFMHLSLSIVLLI